MEKSQGHEAESTAQGKLLLGVVKWEQNSQEFLSSPSAAETVTKAERPSSVKYDLEMAFDVFSALVLVPNLLLK